MAEVKVSDGYPFPLGATFDGKGVNFALFSAHAEKVELCLFDDTGTIEKKRYPIEVNDHNIWHIYLKGINVGQVYGYRVYGPYKPEEGKRFNPHKLLLDPYAKKMIGRLIWHKALFGYDPDSPEQDLSFNTLDSAPYVPKAVVVSDTFDWENEQKPRIKPENSVIYEAHVRGITKLHPKVEHCHRGKFLGLCSDSMMNYFDWLGVTAVELLPVFSFFGEKDGMYTDNYWGYETLAYFVPEAKYLVNNDIDEFKQMVKTMHAHGKEVILDVVYNHTIEGNHLGPTLCYRGIDNESYYTLQKNKRFYEDSTGCGASFNLQNPYVLTLVMDSLRYWADKMHVDGFRLDLATSLSRVRGQFTQDSGFLLSARQDESLRQVKMIAEPWDATMDGYRIGAYPPGWLEWNDRYRDVIRRFWRGDARQIGEFASRISGSSDIFGYSNRGISSSVNFLTSHDGFNLHDLVSYNDKHNDVNGESNRDGNNANWSRNYGVEGNTDDANITELRWRVQRAMTATLLLSFGTPMIFSGDEIGNTQFGNNNPYCQDNILTWLVWDAVDQCDRTFARFVKRLIKLRQSLKIYDRIKFFSGKERQIEKYVLKDIMWLKENGDEFQIADWSDGMRKSIACFVFNGCRSYILIFNAHEYDMDWKLPSFLKNARAEIMLNSAENMTVAELVDTKRKFSVPSRSVLLLQINLPEK